MGKAIELVEGHRRAVVEDSTHSRHPVVELGGDEVANDVARTPPALDVRRVRPGRRQAGEERTEHTWSAVEQVFRVVEELAHGAKVPSRPKSSEMRTTSSSSGVETSISVHVSIAV